MIDTLIRLQEEKDFPYKMKKHYWVTLEEAQILHTVVKEMRPEYIFESGTAHGYSALWLSLEGTPVITFDKCNRKKLWSHLDLSNDNIIYVHDKFSTLPERYPELADKKKLFFIDGSHTRGAVREDYKTVLKYIKPGDVILFHDLEHRGVTPQWEKAKFNGTDVVVYPTDRIMGRVTWTTTA